MRSTRMITLAGSAILLVALVRPGGGQGTPSPSGSDWPMYRHDQAGTGYSPLKQIDRTNVSGLAPAWSYGLQSDAPATGRGGAGGGNSEATPIVVTGVMYVPAANRIVALEPETGKAIWQYVVSGGAPSRRGVAYWPGDGRLPARIIFTVGRRLIALSAATGAIDPGFGTNGEVDMVVPYNSVPLVYKNTLVVGANTPPGPFGSPGNARAYDARTGAKIWEFSSVPPPGAVGHDTWEGDSWRNRSGVNAWPFYFTLDESRGILYLPFASPIGGAYGGDRKGANLFGNSVVAVDVQTGSLQVALPNDPPRHLGCRSPGAAGALRHRPERTHRPDAGAHHEVGLHVHPQPRNGRADLRRRGAPGSQERCADRAGVSHAAVSPQAAAARAE